MEAADQRRGAPGPEEPIAVVRIACQFPGADDVSAFWRLLEAGQSGVTEGVPGSGLGRVGQLFPETSAQAEACRFGAFLEDLDQFDPAFFRMSPIEAQRLDPQQRLLLETSWRALEDAGMHADRLKGSRTGVYAGISNYDYRALVLRASETAEPAASLYSVTGTSFNTAIGRVAFVLGLRGPAIALDTACSSSLVAVHQAVTGLQRGEADLAFAGACTRSFPDGYFPDGYSKCARTRDALAGRTVPHLRRLRQRLCARRRLRHLGLKRLSEAEADGDRIWAVIRGTALNQNGASVGVKPYVIGGHSMGEIAGAQAAGVFTVEDGLRLAASSENSEAAPAAIDMAPPSLTLIDSSTGKPVGPGERLDELYWR